MTLQYSNWPARCDFSRRRIYCISNTNSFKNNLPKNVLLWFSKQPNMSTDTSRVIYLIFIPSQCMDGINRKGNCVCNPGYSGSGCEFCSDQDKYGPFCNQSEYHFIFIFKHICWIIISLIAPPFVCTSLLTFFDNDYGCFSKLSIQWVAVLCITSWFPLCSQ